MRTYLHEEQCTICGSTETAQCCLVPDYIRLRAFATAYYGKLWYRNPRGPWSLRQLQVHFEDIIFISKMYHLYRFSNYTDLMKYFADYDNGNIIIAKITKDVLPAYHVCALDPDTVLGHSAMISSRWLPEGAIPWRIPRRMAVNLEMGRFATILKEPIYERAN